MADWRTLDLSDVLQGVDLLDDVQDVVNIITTAGDIAVAVLQILRAFLFGLPNPLTAAAQLLLNQIQTVLDNLEETGAFGLYMLPTNLEELELYRGGLPQFERLFVQSLYDVEDPNRPQIEYSGVLGALFLFVNHDTPSEFIRQIQLLQAYFGRLVNLSYPAPINVTARPADDNGFTEESLVALFASGQNLTTLRLEWEEPKFTQDLLYDFFAQNKFYIERSKSREGVLLTREATPVTQQDPLDKDRQNVEPVLNGSGEPIYVWDPLDPSDPFVELDPNNDDIGTNFLAGSYFYILRNIQPGVENGYYYRIRSVPKKVDLSGPKFVFQPATGKTITYYELELDGQTYNKSQPSLPVFGYLPTVDYTFDMPTALLNTYRAAYVLRFDEALTESGNVLVGSNILRQQIPRYIQNLVLVNNLDFSENSGFVDYEDAGQTFRVWEGPLFSSATVPNYEDTQRALLAASIKSNEALERDPFSGQDELFDFGLSDQDRFRIWIDRRASQKVDEVLPTLMQNENLFDIVRTAYEDAEPDILNLLLTPNDDPYLDISLRTKVSLVLTTVDRFDIRGAPPNWESLRIFEDLIPEVKPLLDRLFNSINGLFNAARDVASSLDATIEGLQNRLAALDAIVDTLDAIVALIESLPLSDFGISALWVPPSPGGNSRLISELLNAQNKPDSTPNDFSGGVVIAFGGASNADVTSSVNAVRYVFGL